MWNTEQTNRECKVFFFKCRIRVVLQVRSVMFVSVSFSTEFLFVVHRVMEVIGQLTVENVVFLLVHKLRHLFDDISSNNNNKMQWSNKEQLRRWWEWEETKDIAKEIDRTNEFLLLSRRQQQWSTTNSSPWNSFDRSVVLAKITLMWSIFSMFEQKLWDWEMQDDYPMWRCRYRPKAEMHMSERDDRLVQEDKSMKFSFDWERRIFVGMWEIWDQISNKHPIEVRIIVPRKKKSSRRFDSIVRSYLKWILKCWMMSNKQN